jgi:hypothetical protein
MEHFENWAILEKRFEALWQREIIDRCCIAVFAPRDSRYYEQEPFPDDPESKEKYWFDGEFVLRRNLHRFRHTYFGGDAFPQIFLNLGASGHAGYFKNVHYHLDNRTVWFDPMISNWKTEELKFEPVGSLYSKTLSLARYLVQESRQRYFVSMPDISGNMDALAHLRGSENLLMDLILAKDNVKEALERIQTAWLKTNREVERIVKKNNRGGCTIGWLHTWAPGFHGQLQCDLSVMISPDHFNEFVMPELETQSKLLDYPLYHLDGADQIKHLDKILSLEHLQMIQWTCVAGQPPPLAYIPELRKIQAAGKGLLIKIEPQWFEGLMTELSSKGLYLVVEACSKEDVSRILKTAEKLTHD